MGEEEPTLESLVQKKNVIVLKEDFSCDMAEVELNGENVFTGNFWDYHPECQGNVMPEKYNWNGRQGFVAALKLYVEDNGGEVTVREEPYKFEDW